MVNTSQVLSNSSMLINQSRQHFDPILPLKFSWSEIWRGLTAWKSEIELVKEIGSGPNIYLGYTGKTFK